MQGGEICADNGVLALQVGKSLQGQTLGPRNSVLLPGRDVGVELNEDIDGPVAREVRTHLVGRVHLSCPRKTLNGAQLAAGSRYHNGIVGQGRDHRGSIPDQRRYVIRARRMVILQNLVDR